MLPVDQFSPDFIHFVSQWYVFNSISSLFSSVYASFTCRNALLHAFFSCFSILVGFCILFKMIEPKTYKNHRTGVCVFRGESMCDREEKRERACMGERG